MGGRHVGRVRRAPVAVRPSDQWPRRGGGPDDGGLASRAEQPPQDLDGVIAVGPGHGRRRHPAQRPGRDDALHRGERGQEGVLLRDLDQTGVADVRPQGAQAGVRRRRGLGEHGDPGGDEFADDLGFAAHGTDVTTTSGRASSRAATCRTVGTPQACSTAAPVCAPRVTTPTQRNRSGSARAMRR